MADEEIDLDSITDEATLQKLVSWVITWFEKLW